MKAYLQTKTGEIEGNLRVLGHPDCWYWVFNSSIARIEDENNFVEEAAALSHFEKHFGRIIREDG